MTNTELEKLNERLVNKLYDDKRFTAAEIGRAFLATPRHLFVPDAPAEQAYQDQVIPTKFEGKRPISSSSQPAIMAIMLQQLELEEGMNVLEIGAGTGFNAALMSHIVGETGRVTTIDIDRDIVEEAQAHLETAGITNVTVIQADGMLGYPPHAPYDRIILTVSAADIAPAWVDQLKKNGRLLLPLALNGPQKSIAFEKKNNHLDSVSVKNCGFMTLRGEMAAEQGHAIELDESDRGELFLTTAIRPSLDITQLYNWFTQPAATLSTPLTITRSEGWHSLNLWLALHEPQLGTLYATGVWFNHAHIPVLYSFPQNKQPHTLASGIVTADSAAMLVQSGYTEEKRMKLGIKSYGRQTAAAQLAIHLQKWHTAGRPQTDQLQLTVYPRHLPVSPPPDALVIDKKFSQLLVQWNENGR